MSIKHNLLIASASALALAGIVAMTQNASAVEPSQNQSGEQGSYSVVNNPHIPSSMTFAGKKRGSGRNSHVGAP